MSLMLSAPFICERSMGWVRSSTKLQPIKMSRMVPLCHEKEQPIVNVQANMCSECSGK